MPRDRVRDRDVAERLGVGLEPDHRPLPPLGEPPEQAVVLAPRHRDEARSGSISSRRSSASPSHGTTRSSGTRSRPRPRAARRDRRCARPRTIRRPGPTPCASSRAAPPGARQRPNPPSGRQLSSGRQVGSGAVRSTTAPFTDARNAARSASFSTRGTTTTGPVRGPREGGLQASIVASSVRTRGRDQVEMGEAPAPALPGAVGFGARVDSPGPIGADRANPKPRSIPASR
jgi:hypothetical protein